MPLRQAQRLLRMSGLGFHPDCLIKDYRMASAAEQLASNLSLASFSKATELKKRLWFTLGALVLFRLLSFVPIPGIDPVAMNALYQTQSGGILDVFNTFSGGALERFSIVALGVMP